MSFVRHISMHADMDEKLHFPGLTLSKLSRKANGFRILKMDDKRANRAAPIRVTLDTYESLERERERLMECQSNHSLTCRTVT